MSVLKHLIPYILLSAAWLLFCYQVIWSDIGQNEADKHLQHSEQGRLSQVESTSVIDENTQCDTNHSTSEIVHIQEINEEIPLEEETISLEDIDLALSDYQDVRNTLEEKIAAQLIQAIRHVDTADLNSLNQLLSKSGKLEGFYLDSQTTQHILNTVILNVASTTSEKLDTLGYLRYQIDEGHFSELETLFEQHYLIEDVITWEVLALIAESPTTEQKNIFLNGLRDRIDHTSEIVEAATGFMDYGLPIRETYTFEKQREFIEAELLAEQAALIGN